MLFHSHSCRSIDRLIDKKAHILLTNTTTLSVWCHFFLITFYRWKWVNDHRRHTYCLSVCVCVCECWISKGRGNECQNLKESNFCICHIKIFFNFFFRHQIGANNNNNNNNDWSGFCKQFNVTHCAARRSMDRSILNKMMTKGFSHFFWNSIDILLINIFFFHLPGNWSLIYFVTRFLFYFFCLCAKKT